MADRKTVNYTRGPVDRHLEELDIRSPEETQQLMEAQQNAMEGGVRQGLAQRAVQTCRVRVRQATHNQILRVNEGKLFFRGAEQDSQVLRRGPSL